MIGSLGLLPLFPSLTKDEAEHDIVAKLTIGEAKKEGLLGVRVYKFKASQQEILLSYSVGRNELLLIALTHHTHLNLLRR